MEKRHQEKSLVQSFAQFVSHSRHLMRPNDFRNFLLTELCIWAGESNFDQSNCVILKQKQLKI